MAATQLANLEFSAASRTVDVVRRIPRIDAFIVVAGATAFGISAISAIASYAAMFGVAFFDWTFYAGAVDRWLAGEPIYPGGRISTLGSAAGSSYAYPPASVPLMLPFASWPVGAILWEILIVGMLMLGTWSVVRIGWPTRPLIAFGIALAAMSVFDGVMQGVAIGNVNIATAGLLGLVWAGARGRTTATGALAVIKVFPLALAAPLGPKAFGRAASVAAAVCLVTLPLVGVKAWSDYFGALQASQPLCGVYPNLSLACGLSPFVGVEVAKWAGLALAAVFVLLALRAGPTLLGAMLATGAILAPATELHVHYFAIVFVLLIIGLANFNLLLRRDFAAGSPRQVARSLTPRRPAGGSFVRYGWLGRRRPGVLVSDAKVPRSS